MTFGRDSTSDETSRDGETAETFKDRLIRRLNEGHQTVSEYKEKLEDKNVVIFVGSTRSGKSTLINYLIGTNLEAYDTGLTGLKIKKSSDSEGPAIGNTTLSETSTPGIYHMQGTNHTVISDSPGIDDNRGPEQNVINAIFINQLKHARTVKFVMVADINELINDNVNIFLTALRHIDQLLSNCTQVRPSLAIIATKVPERFTQADISSLLQRQILIDEFNFHKYLIENAAGNRDLIGIFKIPTSVGRIGTDLDVNIRNAIHSSQAIDLEKHQITFTLSETAQIALGDIYPEYVDTSYFKTELNKIMNDFKDFDKDLWIFASYDEELDKTKKKLEIKSSLEEHKNISFNQLSDIQRSLETLLGSSLSQEFANNFNFIVMLDQSCVVEEQCKERIQLHYQLLLGQLLEKMNFILLRIQTEIETRQNNQVEFSSDTNYTTVLKCVALNVIPQAKNIPEEVLNKVKETAEKISQKKIAPQAKNIPEEVPNKVKETAEKISQKKIAPQAKNIPEGELNKVKETVEKIAQKKLHHKRKTSQKKCSTKLKKRQKKFLKKKLHHKRKTSQKKCPTKLKKRQKKFLKKKLHHKRKTSQKESSTKLKKR